MRQLQMALRERCHAYTWQQVYGAKCPAYPRTSRSLLRSMRFLHRKQRVLGMICASGVAGRSWSCRVVPIRKELSLSFSNNDNLYRRHNIIQKLRSNFTAVSTTRILTVSMADHSAASDSKSVNAVIKGTVQGVFYRKWTISAAQKLGLNGWVRNLQDGSVEAVFSGPSNAVDAMIQQCHSGPSMAKVTSVEVSKWDHEVPQGFEKRKSS